MKQSRYVGTKRTSGQLKRIRFPHVDYTETFTCVNERLFGMARAIRNDRGRSRSRYRPRKSSQSIDNNEMTQPIMENHQDDSVQTTTVQETVFGNDSAVQLGGDNCSGLDLTVSSNPSDDSLNPLLSEFDEFFNSPTEELRYIEDELNF